MNPSPNAFSNELAQWVTNKCTKSIVFVEFRIKNADAVLGLWNEVSPIPDEPHGGPKTAERSTKCREIQCCTGSVVGINNDGHLKILTCAHVLGPIFSDKHPITPGTINKIYNILILCDHHEQKYQRQLSQNVVQPRSYMRAYVSRVNGCKDMMLLDVPALEARKCGYHLHYALRMAKNFPKRLMDVVMLSWPPHSDRTAVQGKISNASRPFRSISCNNPCGFTMRLSEVDITSEVGSSGAPLLNGAGEYLGILHGGHGIFSFYVSFDDLQQTLRDWGVI